MPGFPGSDSLGRPLVLYFYPKDFTSGCTKEACLFRDAYSELRASHGVEIAGVSRDSAESHERFRAEHRLPFPLVSDAGGAISRQFGVAWLWGLLPLVKRVTFVVDAGGIIRGLFHHEAAIDRHLKEVRQCLESIRPGAR